MCEVQRKRITRKKWAVMSWVRAPPWKHEFLCKTVQVSEKGTDKVGGQEQCLLRGLSCGRRLAVMAVALLTTEVASGPPTMPDLPRSPPLHTPEHGQTLAHLLWRWHRAAGRQGQPGGASLLALDFLS